MDPHYRLHRPGYWTLFLKSPSAVCFAITFKLKPNSWMLPLGPKVALPIRDLEDLTKKKELGLNSEKSLGKYCNGSSASRDFPGNMRLQKMSFV